MKILYVINALTVGGAQTLLSDISSKMAESGHQVIVAAFRDGVVKKTLNDNGIETVILGECFFDVFAFGKLFQLIRSFKPDIVHTNLFRATAWARLAKILSGSHAKIITTIHGSETAIYHLVEKLMVKNSDYMLFPSKFLSDWYQNSIKAIPDLKYKIVYPGVAISPLLQKEKHESVIIGSLCRLHQVKGIDTLLKAVSIVKNRNIAVKVIIGGAGKESDNLKKLSETLKISDCCSFEENITDKKKYLEGLDIFVAPSRKEAFGINICEAQERGIPVVASRVGGIPEIIENGYNGLLFEKDNPEELADSLVKLINDKELRELFGKNGRQKIENLFDGEKTLREHMNLYEKITDNKTVHFAISSRELGGGERLAIDLIKNLQARGWRVSATCAGNPLYKELLSMNVTCSVASMELGGLLFAAKLFNDLRAFKPAVISSHLNKASLFSGLFSKVTGIKCISHIHGLNKKIYYQFSTKQIAVSGAVKKHLLEQGANIGTLVAINNCIDKPAVGTRCFPDRPLNISITAKLHANKGHKWALEAISNNMKKLNIGKIHIFGDGPERENLEKLCNSLAGLNDKVVFHGFVNDPSLFYDDIDVALLPSLGEGIPLSLLEVMRLGIPCLATNVGGIPEIIENNESGILFEPNDANALIEAINRLSDRNIYEKFSLGAFERFKKVNNHDAMIDSFEALLLEAIK